MDIKKRFKNPIFWLGLVGIIFSAANIDFNTLTNWNLFAESLLSIIKNPVLLMSVIMAIIGVFADTSTPGIGDKKKRV